MSAETYNLMTQSQEITVGVLTVLGGSLSLLGSTTIIYNIISKQKFKRDSYHRLLLGTCVFDAVSSVGWVMQTFAAPKRTSDRYLSIGNVASCTAQAFLTQCAIGYMIYNGCLTIYFLVTIRYNLEKVQVVQMERVMHVISICWGLGSALVPLPLHLYNENLVGPGCWLSDYPVGCSADPDVTCIRGSVAPELIGYVIALLPACFSLIAVLVSNVLVYRTARTKELATQIISRRLSQTFSNEQQQTRRTKQIASQASYYVVVYINSLLWQFALRVLTVAQVITRENESQWTFLIALSHLFTSSAGFGFLLVFVRPRYLRFRERDGMPRLRAFVAALSLDNRKRQSNGGASSILHLRDKSRRSAHPSNAYLDDSAHPRLAFDNIDRHQLEDEFSSAELPTSSSSPPSLWPSSPTSNVEGMIE